MIEGEDHVVHNGEVLPVLSASAKRMKMMKLLDVPLPTYDTKVPGSLFWTRTAFWFCRRVSSIQFRTTSSTHATPSSSGGALCCGWHTNGLMDPLGIFLQHPKEFVVGGRHDLVTRPVLGWWTRKLAVQPVIRKAELLRGGCSEEEAQQLNGRSLLALAKGIAHGHGCVLFPEGTSHSESHMIRFRTGPIRTVLAAAALAIADNMPMPYIQPVGLHFRRREYFRTDQYIEFAEPLMIQPSQIPQTLIEAVKEGNWVEPPEEVVFQFRDQLQSVLPQYTPDAPTWDDHAAYHLLGHLRANHDQQPLNSWKDEVLAARREREQLAPSPREFPPQPIDVERMAHARQAAILLNQFGLDGRDIHVSNQGLRKFSPIKLVQGTLALMLMLLTSPVWVTAFGIQLIAGRLLGDLTDEGLDARTSYQFLAAFFGSLFIWPLIATGWLVAAICFENDISTWSNVELNALHEGPLQQILSAWLIGYVILFFLFFLSGHSFARGWDAWVDCRKALTRLSFNQSTRDQLQLHLDELTSQFDESTTKGSVQTG